MKKLPTGNNSAQASYPSLPSDHDPIADQREAERLERVERLLTQDPRLTKASAMTFEAEAARVAAMSSRHPPRLTDREGYRQ